MKHNPHGRVMALMEAFHKMQTLTGYGKYERI